MPVGKKIFSAFVALVFASALWPPAEHIFFRPARAKYYAETSIPLNDRR